MSTSDHSRRVALVTGAARGQGLAIVHKLLEKDYDVVACDVLADDLEQALAELPSDRVVAQALDVTSQDSWDQAVTVVNDAYGALHGLVNNAGILYRSPIADDDPADFERAWRVNCFGPYLGIKAFLPLLTSSAPAAIVNTVSTAGMRPFPNHTGYATSKWALRGLSLSAAVDLAGLGIRVNSVMPGSIATPMHNAETTQRLSKTSLLHRTGTADEIAATVVFLLSEESSFTVGGEFVVDGGQLIETYTGQN